MNFKPDLSDATVNRLSAELPEIAKIPSFDGTFGDLFQMLYIRVTTMRRPITHLVCDYHRALDEAGGLVLAFILQFAEWVDGAAAEPPSLELLARQFSAIIIQLSRYETRKNDGFSCGTMELRAHRAWFLPRLMRLVHKGRALAQHLRHTKKTIIVRAEFEIDLPVDVIKAGSVARQRACTALFIKTRKENDDNAPRVRFRRLLALGAKPDSQVPSRKKKP